MSTKDQPFSCAEVIVKELAKLRKTIVILIIIAILSNVATAFLVSFFVSKKVFFTYFKTKEALEKIHNVQIDYGEVSSLPKNK